MPVFMCNVTVSYVHPDTGEIGSANRALIQTGRSEKVVREQFLKPLAFQMQEELGLEDKKHKFGFAFSCKKLKVAPLEEMLRVARLDEDVLNTGDRESASPTFLN